jgi:phosphatidylserine/phosphatidylglycerophosphate/cardiolipin synthase-like enzyme
MVSDPVISVISNNDEAWKLYTNTLTNAKKSILITVWYVFENDWCINAISEILIKKAKEGVEVVVVYTHCTEQMTEMVLTCEEEGQCSTDIFVENMENNNVSCINFSDMGGSYGTHRKVLVVDSQFTIVGSRNLHNFYYGNEEELEKAHLNPIEIEYIRLIDQTKHSILIVNNQTMYTTGINDALVRAVKRGVKITVYANGPKQQPSITTSPYTFDILKSHRNFTLWINESTHLLHRKYAVFDNEVCCNGSFNFDEWSYSKNAEILVVVKGAKGKIVCRDLEKRTLEMGKHFTKEPRGRFSMLNFVRDSMLHMVFYLIEKLMW